MMPPITAPPPIHAVNHPPAALAGNKTSSPGNSRKPETPNQYKIQPSSSKPDQNQLFIYDKEVFDMTVYPLF